MKLPSLIRQFLRTPRTVGSIFPSSSVLVKKMLNLSNLESAKVVVELGSGTGVFTQEIFKRVQPTVPVICIEVNQHFCQQIQPLFEQRGNSHLVCASATKLTEVLKQLGYQCVDTIISSLPYNALPSSVSKEVLKGVTKSMNEHSEFLTYVYSLSCRQLFDEVLPNQDWTLVYRNIPPAYVGRMTL